MNITKIQHPTLIRPWISLLYYSLCCESRVRIKVLCREQSKIRWDEKNTGLAIFKRSTWNLHGNQMANKAPATPNNGNYKRHS